MGRGLGLGVEVGLEATVSGGFVAVGTGVAVGVGRAVGPGVAVGVGAIVGSAVKVALTLDPTLSSSSPCEGPVEPRAPNTNTALIERMMAFSMVRLYIKGCCPRQPLPA